MQQETALEIMMSGKNVFLTGAAGAGKTYILNRYIREMRQRGATIAVTASTGIAATHLGGMTVHSWSGIGIKNELSDKAVRDLVLTSYLSRRLSKTDILIIDEISMLSASVFDLIDKICRAGRGEPHIPFGGMQIILCGDLFQLPPIVAHQPNKNIMFRPDEDSVFVCRSRSWELADLAICYLETQHRQSDNRLVSLLNAIRKAEINDSIEDMVQELLQTKHEEEFTIDLFTHNADVDALNMRKLLLLESEGKRYRMKGEGKASLSDQLKRTCLAPEDLVLKRGARVVFVKNDPEHEYVNGTLGVVDDFDGTGFPIVRTRDERLITAYPQTWKLEVDGREKARVQQVPLRLAWAITVHKSQGMTLDGARVDLGSRRIIKKGYVALSRVRSLDGLDLVGCNSQALQVHPYISEYDNELLSLSEHLNDKWSDMSSEDRRLRIEKFLERVSGKVKKKGATLEKTEELLKKRRTLAEMSKERKLKTTTLLSHIEKLLEKERIVPQDITYLAQDSGLTKKDLEAIRNAFHAHETWNLSPVFEHFQGKYSYETLRLARIIAKMIEAGDES